MIMISKHADFGQPQTISKKLNESVSKKVSNQVNTELKLLVECKSIPAQHELPPGLMRIRRFGFMGNNCRKRTLRQIRLAVGAGLSSSKLAKKKSTAQLMLDLTGIDITLYSKCKIGKLKKIDEFDGSYQTYPFSARGSQSR